MNREQIKFSSEREFVTNLITSDKFCQAVIPNLQISYFDSDYTRIVVDWVVEYYHKYSESPKNNILSLYRTHCDEIDDDSIKNNVLIYLKKIDENLESLTPNNVDYSIDQGLKFLKEKSLRNFSDDLQACLDTGDIDKASEMYDNYRKVATMTDDEIDMLNGDVEQAYNSLTEVQEEIITLPEACEKVFGKLHRNDFVGVGAKAKGGKTWALIWLGLMSMLQRRKVVHFSLEMTASETFNRYWTMAFGAKSGTVPVGTKIVSSRFIDPSEEDGKFTIEEFETTVNKSYSIDVEEKRKMFKMYTHGGNVRIVSYPMNSASINTLKSKCNDFIAEGYVPDVVIVDYADIMKLSGNSKELRNQLDATWKDLRGWARENHILLITATQLNRGAFGKGHVDSTNVSEDIRKLGHVTSMVAIDQTPAMKKKHIASFTPFVARADEAVDTCVFCQNLKLGQFVFGKPHLIQEVDFSDDDDD